MTADDEFELPDPDSRSLIARRASIRPAAVEKGRAKTEAEIGKTSPEG